VNCKLRRERPATMLALIAQEASRLSAQRGVQMAFTGQGDANFPDRDMTRRSATAAMTLSVRPGRHDPVLSHKTHSHDRCR
jgi:hypothetical protein